MIHYSHLETHGDRITANFFQETNLMHVEALKSTKNKRTLSVPRASRGDARKRDLPLLSFCAIAVTAVDAKDN